MKLKSFELQSDIDDEDLMLDADTIIMLFLAAFNGLEELFLCTNAPSRTTRIWTALLRHKSTLKKFVHHQRITDIDPNRLSRDVDKDMHNLSLEVDDFAELLTNRHPFSELDLECVSLCCSFDIQVSSFHQMQRFYVNNLAQRILLYPLRSKSTLKVLY
jgi:hypothetical protein